MRGEVGGASTAREAVGARQTPTTAASWSWPSRELLTVVGEELKRPSPAAWGQAEGRGTFRSGFPEGEGRAGGGGCVRRRDSDPWSGHEAQGPTEMPSGAVSRVWYEGRQRAAGNGLERVRV